jgi:hypothetical protein
MEYLKLKYILKEYFNLAGTQHVGAGSKCHLCQLGMTLPGGSGGVRGNGLADERWELTARGAAGFGSEAIED